VPESEKARGRIVNEIAVGGFKRALAANLPIGLATDAPVMPHGLNAREIEYRVLLGEPPMHAIVDATSAERGYLGMQDRIGSVTAGKLADSDCGGGQPAHRHRGAARCALRDEGRHRLQGRAVARTR